MELLKGLFKKGKEKKIDKDSLLHEYRNKFYQSKANYDYEQYDDKERIYRGTKETLPNINSTLSSRVALSNNVRNIAFELIESKINTEPPESNVISLKAGFDAYARMISEKNISDMSLMRWHKIADRNERDTAIHGLALVLLDWDSKGGTHEVAGEKKFVYYHPKQIIPQPGIYDIDDMDYFFLENRKTKLAIKKETGIDVQGTDEHTELNTLENPTSERGFGTDNTNMDEYVSEIVCFFRDEEGDVGKVSWANETLLCYEPKYYYPRVMECQECGYENPQGTEICENCGSKKLAKKIIYEEEIQEDLTLDPITYPELKAEVSFDPITGEQKVIEKLSQVIIPRVVPAGTIIPMPKLQRYPVLIRKNISKAFSFDGISDIDVIRDQQESAKKVYSRMEEKVMLAGGLIAIPDSMTYQPTSKTYDVVRGSIPNIGAIKKYDFTSDISQDMAYGQEMYNVAKSTLGITDSFQGKYDPSAKSGRAKEVQVQQSAGRLQSPIKNKYSFFSEMFELMFYFDIIFTNEKRYYVTLDEKGNNQYKQFDKHDLLVQDADNEWYYNTDFLFKATVGNTLAHDKLSQYERVQMDFQMGALTKEQYWQILSHLDFPLANKILEQEKMVHSEGDKFIRLLQVLQQMPPEQAIMFLQSPVEQQAQLVQEVLQGEGQQQMPRQGQTVPGSPMPGVPMK